MAKPKTRDDFPSEVKELLARRAGYRCSICEDPTVGPHSDDERSVYLGEASHICSAAPNGPRANPKLTAAERTAALNGIHLCKTHARLIDVDVNSYTVERLNEIKLTHERKVRALIVGTNGEFDAGFLNSHETQIMHGRGEPSLSDLWVHRSVMQFRRGQVPLKRDAVNLIEGESGILALTGDQWSGRTSLLKTMCSRALNKRNCIWLDGREITETATKDPVKFLAAGYRKLYQEADGWHRFLDADKPENVIFVDDLHLSPLNLAAKRRFLAVLQNLAGLVVVATGEAFLIELVAVSAEDGLPFTHWRLLDLTRADCAQMVEKWCGFGADSIPDDELDGTIADTQDRLELVLGRKVMPRQPLYVLTALQMIDAGTPLDTAVGSFGGVYETVIHLAISKNARNQAAISSERTYLEELAYWCASQPESDDREGFNKWFAERKAIRPARVAEIEASVRAKGFLASRHQGFRFSYQKYYFLASFIRNNPNRPGVSDYVSKLVVSCWNEDFANTALFLAYLQPSSFLLDALLSEVRGLFAGYSEFQVDKWQIESQFSKEFFHGLTLSNDAEKNRRLLAERLDEETPVASAECSCSGFGDSSAEEEKALSDFIKGHHLVKLVGQLIRNSPISFDAEQKTDLVEAGFNLTLRMVSFMTELYNPMALKNLALAQLRDSVLKAGNRAELEAKLSGIIYGLLHLLVFSALRHACCFLAHPDLALTYQKLLNVDSEDPRFLTQKLITCGLNFELRSPNAGSLERVCGSLTPAGQDILRTWAWMFLWYNRVSVSKRQAILESLEMTPAAQLLLPKAT